MTRVDGPRRPVDDEIVLSSWTCDMPVHDWTKVSAGVFHDFHVSWIAELKKSLNGGLLPEGYYAMAEQVTGEIGPDVVTLHTRDPSSRASSPGGEHATAIEKAPPRVHWTATADESEVYAMKRRTLLIRHTSGDRVIALLEVLSPGNKNRSRPFQRFLDKAFSAITGGYHLLLVDLFPPGPHDRTGVHGALWAEFEDRPYQAPPGKPLTLASYSAGSIPRAYVEPVAVGMALPEMPLFLDEEWYISVPLERTYGEAYASLPARWRRILEPAP